MPRDTKLAKEDLFSNRNVISDALDDEPFERRILQDAQIVQPSSNRPSQVNNGRMTFLPPSHRDPMAIDQFKQNNDQLQKILMQLQAPSSAQQHRPSNSNVQAPIILTKSNFNESDGNYQIHPSYSRGSGPNHQKLNKDNSILEIAKMQNSNGSNSDTYQTHSIIDKDFFHHNFNQMLPSKDGSPITRSNYPNLTNLDYLNPPSMLLNSGSVATNTYGLQSQYAQHQQQQQQQSRQVSQVDKENFNSNNNLLFQMRGEHHQQQQQIKQEVIAQKPYPQYVFIDQKMQAPVNTQIQYAKTMKDFDGNPQYIRQQDQVAQMNKTAQMRDLTEQEIKKRELMVKFDDIPIKELNKADGYQQNIKQETPNEDDINDSTLTILQRIDDSQWKVRVKAYKEISELFHIQHSKDSQKQELEENPLNGSEEDDQGPNPFDTYSSCLEKIISDSNLVAQYEGLNCLYTFVRFSPDLKQVIFMTQVILLEKIQLNKPNLREITTKILLSMIKKDKNQSVLAPELFRRFKNKNIKIALFSLEIVVQALRNGYFNDEITLKQIFKSAQDLVSHTNKELKETSIELIREIYILTNDDASAYIRNLKSLRPIQLKEIKDYLSEVEKTPSTITLFAKDTIISANEGSTPKKSKTTKLDSDQILSNRELNQNSQEQNSMDHQEESQLEVDLVSLIPENYNEIPYISQINQKKKVMEVFNAELEKLTLKKQGCHIVNKDYTMIFNVLSHMLEDSNALVFMEAIKTVELLSILMGKQLKQQKLKSLLAQLVEKYKETKTAPVQAVNKTLSTILKKQIIPLASLIEYLVCQLAHCNKNPRVKQLILEKVDLILNEEQHSQDKSLKEDELIAIFKMIKDKVIQFIQKDTNAGVRDAAVTLLITFKSFLFDSVIVDETISTLPKYRVQEISKIAMEKNKVLTPIPVKQQSSQAVIRPNSAKEDIIPTLKKDIFSQLNRLAQADIANINVQVLANQIDEALELLGEEGLSLNKAKIVSNVHNMLLLSRINFCENFSVIEALLVLIKQIFCIDRSVTIDPQTGQSKELDQAIEISLYGSLTLENKKQPEALLNVLLSAAGSASIFFESFTRSLLVFSQQDNCISLLDFVFKWIALKVDFLAKKGVAFSDFEDLRSAGFQFMNDRIDQNVKNQIVQILVQFKNHLSEKQTSAAQNLKEMVPKDGTVQSFSFGSQNLDQKSNIMIQVPAQNKPYGQLIVETLEQDFDRGLLMIKQIQENIQNFDFGSKEMVFNKLLAIVTTQSKTQQHQYQQAYGLKALIWMRQEIYGLEDSFKFTTHCMSAYAQAVIDKRDSSVELYLLNQWVIEFTIRDLIDRVASASLLDEHYFSPLFAWITEKLKQNTEEKWQLEDFRKIGVILAKNLLQDQVVTFFTNISEKFGKVKVKDFFEIQLMHHQNDYNNFVAWYKVKFREEQNELHISNAIKMPKLKLPFEEESKSKGANEYDDTELRDALGTNPNQNIESVQQSARGGVMDHSKLYKQLREQRKYNKHSDEDTFNDQKYDQIISRLEAQLQQKSLQDEEINGGQILAARPTTRSDQNRRYQSIQESDLQRPKTPGLQQAQNTSLNYSNINEEDIEKRLQQSSVKENHYLRQIESLEEEKRRLDQERQTLLQVKNQETKEWQQKYQEMLSEHDDVMNNLKEANQQYLNQVGENESLRNQLKQMQIQHQQMMEKFKEFEQKLNEQDSKAILQKQQKVQVVSEENMEIIKSTFNNQISAYGQTQDSVIQKVQELLLNFTDGKKLREEEISEPLFIYYQQMRSQEQKLNLIKALHQSLENSEDVLFALPHHSYKALLGFNLQIFAQEKAKLEEKIIRSSIQGGRGQGEQNEITIEVQKIVSKLLNSKEFTTSLVTLFEILRSQMPNDLNVDLSGSEKQHFKVILRCISRINKALPSEHPDLIRSFDVLVEMQKIFMRNPPESLREDLPCLEDFDLVYRGLKDVADKMMELQPDKVKVFLNFVAQSTQKHKNENAFIKYMRQVMGMNKAQQEDTTHYDDDDYEY